MPSFTKLVLFCLLLVPGSLRANELAGLVREYSVAQKKVTGPLGQRPGLVILHVQPVLEKIGALSSSASERWLAAELDNARTAAYVREAIPRALLSGATENAVKALLRGMGRRPTAVQEASLRALAEAGTSLGPADAKLLLSQLGGRTLKSEEARTARRLELVVEVLKNSTDPETGSWLEGEAYQAAAGKTDRLLVLVRLAKEKKIEGARAELVKLLSHRSGDLAGRAIEALAAIGPGDAFEKISAALDKPGADVQFRARALDALVDTPAGIEFAVKSAAAKDPVMRAIAMGSLALRASEPLAMKALLAGLDDTDLSVRNVALRSLRQVRIKSMIGALIKAVDSHPDESFRVRALELLVNVSGQNFGLAGADWKKWWAQSEASFEFPKEEELGFTTVKKRGLEYFGIEVSSKRLGLIVDISSSMRQMVPVKAESLKEEEEEEEVEEDEDGGSRTRVAPVKKKKKKTNKDAGIVLKDGKARKIDILKKEMARLLKKLPADTFLNMISFDATFRPWQKALQPLRGKGRAKALAYVARITTGSGTNVFDTLEFALKDKRVDTIYLLTDGLPTRGRIKAPAAIIKEIDNLNRARGVTIHTIAFGAESDLLRQLAERNGGQYRFVDRY